MIIVEEMEIYVQFASGGVDMEKTTRIDDIMTYSTITSYSDGLCLVLPCLLLCP